ncbi:hypothetical protein BH23ACT9_BH23ACT9_13290 [soil metagenome]
MTVIVNAVLFVGLAVVGAVFWWRRRTASTAWLLLTFGTMGAIVVQDLVLGPVDRADLVRFSPWRSTSTCWSSCC